MIDLHCHLLPGLDDGPATIEQSIELCSIAVADGITRAICTPHLHPGRWENTIPGISSKCTQLQQALDRRQIPLQLGFAAEVRLTDQVMQQVEKRDIPFFGEVDGYQVMLLEFPHGHVVPGSEKLVAWLLEQGIRPLIAHPERNKQIMKEPGQIRPFVDAGCWLQLTASSVTGYFGKTAQAAALQLLDWDLVTVVASDGHNAKVRKPALGEAYNAISDSFGVAKALQLMQDMPLTIAGAQFSDALLPV